MTRFLAPAAAKLTTVTFNSSQSWTVPAGVSLLVVLQGKGEDGSPDSYETQTFAMNDGSPTTVTSTPRSRSTDYNLWVTQANKFTTGTGTRTVSWTYHSVSSDGVTTMIGSSGDSARVRGTASISKSSAPSGSWDGTLADGAFYVNVSVLVNQNDGYTGGGSTAFGMTFPGAAGAAVVQTFNNVAVTPGQTYSIVVAFGGFVTVQYYA